MRLGAIAEFWRRKGSGGSGLSLRSDNLDSIAELYTEDDFRQLVVAIEATPTSFRSLGELEDHGERSLVRETSFGAHGAVAHRGEQAFDDVRGAEMPPVLGREVVEGEQRVAILDQALDRLVVFDAPGLDEGVEGRKRILLCLGHPDFLQRPLGFRLLAVRQFAEDIGGFVHPATLAARLRPYLFDRLPDSERTIGDRELGANRQPTPLEIEQAVPAKIAHFRAHVNAVDPEVDVAFAERSRLLQRACSSDQASLRRPIVEAESPPASLPSNAISASSKSPVEMPLR